MYDISRIEKVRERKSERYAALAFNISEQGLKCHIHTLEIGTRGYISPRNVFLTLPIGSITLVNCCHFG